MSEGGINNMECEHIISNADDDCYSCLVTDLKEELKLVSEQRDLIAKKADKVEEHNAQLVEAWKKGCSCREITGHGKNCELLKVFANQDPTPKGTGEEA